MSPEGSAATSTGCAMSRRRSWASAAARPAHVQVLKQPARVRAERVARAEVEAQAVGPVERDRGPAPLPDRLEVAEAGGQQPPLGAAVVLEVAVEPGLYVVARDVLSVAAGRERVVDVRVLEVGRRPRDDDHRVDAGLAPAG